MGALLSAVYAEIRGISPAVFEENLKDTTILIELFLQVDAAQLSDSSAGHYRNIVQLVVSTLAVDKYNAKIASYTEAGDLESAAKLYDQVSLAHPDDVLSRFNAGLAYEGAGLTDDAVNRYWQVVNLFPGTNEAIEAEARYLALTGEQEVMGLPEGVDASSETAPIDVEALLAQLPPLPETEPEPEPEPVPGEGEGGPEGQEQQNEGQPEGENP